jgi:hypothetical protein
MAVKHGIITWPGEIDLAPDARHDEIKLYGKAPLISYARVSTQGSKFRASAVSLT